MRSLGLFGCAAAVSLFAACGGEVTGDDERSADAQALVSDGSTGGTVDAGPADGAAGGDAAAPDDAAPADYDWMANISFYEIAATGFSCIVTAAAGGRAWPCSG